MKKLAFLATLLILGLSFTSCEGKKGDDSSDKAAATAPAAPAANDAVSISTITLEERITQVTNGKGLMTPFKEILTEAEIKAVAEYTLSLKK